MADIGPLAKEKILVAYFIESMGEQKLAAPILVLTDHMFVNIEEHIPLVSSATFHENENTKGDSNRSKPLRSLDPFGSGMAQSAQCDAALGRSGIGWIRILFSVLRLPSNLLMPKAVGTTGATSSEPRRLIDKPSDSPSSSQTLPWKARRHATVKK
jgi:hypothetical protein